MLNDRQDTRVATAAPAHAAIANPATPAATTGVTSVLDRAKALLANHATLLQADYERLIALLRELSPSELTQALNEVGNMADADARRWLTEGLVETWGERDPANALAWAAEHLSPDGQRRRLPMLISDWAAQDPNAAAKWAQDFTDRRNATLSVSGLNSTTFDEMARTGNQARALEMRLQESLFQNLGAGFATKDLDTAIKTWAKLPSMAEQVAFMDGLSQHLATGEACQKIAQFLVQQSPMDIQNLPGGTWEESRALNSVFSTWASFDRESATRFVENIDDQRTKTILVSIVGNQWLESDPVGAANWWSQQTPSDGLGDALEEIAGGWAMRDPRATGQWLNQLPAGAERDRGVIAFVGEIAEAHPDIAAAWVQTISDPTKREEWVSNLHKLKAPR